VSDHYPVDVLIQCISGTVRVGAFNIKTFGQAKVGNEDVRNILVKVVLIALEDYTFNNCFYSCLYISITVILLLYAHCKRPYGPYVTNKCMYELCTWFVALITLGTCTLVALKYIILVANWYLYLYVCSLVVYLPLRSFVGRLFVKRFAL